jgi:hypothetical protein
LACFFILLFSSSNKNTAKLVLSVLQMLNSKFTA